jgi:hypothetical protein
MGRIGAGTGIAVIAAAILTVAIPPSIATAKALPTNQPPPRSVVLLHVPTSLPNISSQLRKRFRTFIPLLSSSAYVFANQIEGGTGGRVTTIDNEQSTPEVTYPSNPTRDLPAVTILSGELTSRRQQWSFDLTVFTKPVAHYARGTVSFVGRCIKGKPFRNQFGYVQTFSACQQVQIQFSKSLIPSTATIAKWESSEGTSP